MYVTQSNRLDTQFEHRSVIIKYDIINIIVRYDNEIVNNSIKRSSSPSPREKTGESGDCQARRDGRNLRDKMIIRLAQPARRVKIHCARLITMANMFRGWKVM